MRTTLAVFAMAALAASGCDQAQRMVRPAKAPRDRPPAEARIEKSIELPGGQGTVHVLAVPTGLMESARCVVVTSSAGGPAVSCAPKDIDLPPGND